MKRSARQSKEQVAIVETCSNRVLGVKLSPNRTKAVTLALEVIVEIGAGEMETNATITDSLQEDGFWDDGCDYRVSVVKCFK